MITGYNTDVKHDGKVFHVQTEDKGAANPIIETLVYVGGGQIIASRQYSYANLVAGGKCDEIKVMELLESQHKRIIRWITGGKYDSGGPPPFGASIISDRSFDEVVLEWLSSQAGAEPIEIVAPEEIRAVEGAAAAIRILVRGEASNAPVAGAKITVTLSPATGKPVKLLEAATGPDGRLSGKIDVPAGAAGGILLVEARQGPHTDCLEVAVAAP